MKDTIGQRIYAAVVSYQLGISVDRARKLYITNPDFPKLDESWETLGREILRGMEASGNGSVKPIAPENRGPS